MQDFKLLGNDDARLVQFIQHAADGFRLASLVRGDMACFRHDENDILPREME
jgi:hypothetical protein